MLIVIHPIIFIVLHSTSLWFARCFLQAMSDAKVNGMQGSLAFFF
jgi:hypothetical protein